MGLGHGGEMLMTQKTHVFYGEVRLPDFGFHLGRNREPRLFSLISPQRRLPVCDGAWQKS